MPTLPRSLALAVVLATGTVLAGGGKLNKELEGPPSFGGVENVEQQQQQQQQVPRYNLPPTYYNVNDALKWLGRSKALQNVYFVELELLQGISDLFEKYPNLQQKASIFIAATLEPSSGGSTMYKDLDRRLGSMELILSAMKRSRDAGSVADAEGAWAALREFISFDRDIVRKVLGNPQAFADMTQYQWKGRTYTHRTQLSLRKDEVLRALTKVAQDAEKVSLNESIRTHADAASVQQQTLLDQMLPEDRATYDSYRRLGQTYGYSFLPLPLVRDDLKPAALQHAVTAQTASFGRNDAATAPRRRVDSNGGFSGQRPSAGGDLDFGFGLR